MNTPMSEPTAPPEYNVTGHDYSRRDHFTYSGPPIIDIHTHVTHDLRRRTSRPGRPAAGATRHRPTRPR